MKIRFCSFLTTAIAVALLAGCGSFTTPQSVAQSRAASHLRPSTVNTGWLYLSEDEYNVGIVYIFGYPDGNRVPTKAIANLGYVYGPCVSAKGNVWIPAITHRASRVYEFAADKTKVIARLDIPGADNAGECAVDPDTNDLAVIGSDSVNIFTNAQGKPVNYALTGGNFIAGCTYDGSGNLFVDAMKQISTSFTAFALYELPKGAKSFKTIELDGATGYAGGDFQSERQDLALLPGATASSRYCTALPLSAGGKGHHAVRSFERLELDAWFAIGDGRIVGTSRVYGTKIRYWPYPGGGGWTTELTSSNVEGMAIAPL